MGLFTHEPCPACAKLKTPDDSKDIRMLKERIAFLEQALTACQKQLRAARKT